MGNINIIDVLIVIFIFINLFVGWKKGLILSVFNFLGLIVSLYIAKIFSKTFALIIRDNVVWVQQLQENIALKIHQKYTTNSEIINGIENGTLLNKLNLPEYLEKNLYELLKKADLNATENIGNKIAELIVESIVDIMAVIILFIIIFIIIKIVAMLLNMVFQIPILKGINQMGGLILGFVLGNIFVYLIMALIVVFNSMGLDLGIQSAVLDSKLGQYYFNNNLIFVIINYFF